MKRIKQEFMKINSNIEHIQLNIHDLKSQERMIRNKTMHNTVQN
jgi:hypothetical protein